VFLWSSARVGGVPVAALLKSRGERLDELRHELEREVRYANISIIEGHDASQYESESFRPVSPRWCLMMSARWFRSAAIKRFWCHAVSASVVGRGGVMRCSNLKCRMKNARGSARVLTP